MSGSVRVQRSRLAQFEDDDHNNPALLAVAGKPLVCFYSRHDAEEGLRYRISTAPLTAKWRSITGMCSGAPVAR